LKLIYPHKADFEKISPDFRWRVDGLKMIISVPYLKLIFIEKMRGQSILDSVGEDLPTANHE